MYSENQVILIVSFYQHHFLKSCYPAGIKLFGYCLECNVYCLSFH